MTDIVEVPDRRDEDARLTRLEQRMDGMAKDVARVIEILDKAEAAFEFADWVVTKLKNGLDRTSDWVRPIAIVITGGIAVYHAVTGNLKLAATWLFDQFTK